MISGGSQAPVVRVRQPGRGNLLQCPCITGAGIVMLLSLLCCMFILLTCVGRVLWLLYCCAAVVTVTR
jgi:hypothetical protein